MDNGLCQEHINQTREKERKHTDFSCERELPGERMCCNAAGQREERSFRCNHHEVFCYTQGTRRSKAVFCFCIKECRERSSNAQSPEKEGTRNFSINRENSRIVLRCCKTRGSRGIIRGVEKRLSKTLIP